MTFETPGRRRAPTSRVGRLATAVVLPLALASVVAAPRPPVAAQRVAGTAALDSAAVGRFVTAYRRRTGLPGAAIAVTQGDRILLAAGYGHGADGTPITARTRLPIASLSKSVTALAVMQLVDAGRVALDAPVRRYLPEFVMVDPRAGAITVRQLLDHTSGMADMELREKSISAPASLQAAVARLRTVRLASAPGSASHYHNPNYWVAARLVEVVGGEPFAAYLTRHVFVPAGMTASTTVGSLREAPDVLPGHIRLYGASVARPEPDWYLDGSSGVVTTAEDLARWLVVQAGAGRAGNGARLVSAGSVAEMHDRSLGWRLGPEPGAITHTGWLFTYTARQVLLPAGGYGLAVVANRGLNLGPDDSAELMRGLMTMLDGATPEPPVPTGQLVDLVLVALTLATAAAGVRAVRQSRAWAGRWDARPSVGAALGTVGWAVPVATLAGLRRLLVAVFAGRDGSWGQLLYLAPSLVGWLAVSAAFGLAVILTRTVLVRRLRVARARGVGPPAGSPGLFDRVTAGGT